MQHAVLGLASLGWPVFPVSANSKIPRAGSAGFYDATCDPARINKWMLGPPCNWAVRTGRVGDGDPARERVDAPQADYPGLVCLDVDGAGHGAVPNSWLTPEIQDRLSRAGAAIQDTPSGGVQYIWLLPHGKSWPTKTGVLPNIDLKCSKGYFLTAPSTRSGVAYAYRPGYGPETAQVAPGWVIALIDGWCGERPAPANVAPVNGHAVILEGGRRTHLLALAGRLRHVGIGAGLAAELHAANDADCSPPLLPAEVDALIASALKSWAPAADITAPPDALDAAIDALLKPPAIPLRPPRRLQWPDMAALLAEDPPPMRWVFEDIIPASALFGLDAAGGTGKSFFLLQLAISAATGHALLPSFQPSSACRVYALFAEDPPDEIHRRLRRVLDAYNVLENLHGRITANLRLGCGAPHRLIDKNGFPTPEFGELTREIEAFAPGLVILDPRSHVFNGDENDNQHVSRFMAQLQMLCDNGASVIVSHHVSKGRSMELSSDSGRGASAARDAARGVLSMAPLDAEVAAKMGLDNHRLYARMLLSKSNYAPPRGSEWLLKRDTGATGGVLREIDADGQAAALAQRALEAALEIGQAVADFIGANASDLPLREWYKSTELRAAIRYQFGRDRATIKLVSDGLDAAIRHGLLIVEQVYREEGAGRPQSVPRCAPKSE